LTLGKVLVVSIRSQYSRPIHSPKAKHNFQSTKDLPTRKLPSQTTTNTNILSGSKMFLFMPQTFRYNKFTVEKAEDVLSFRPSPLAQPRKGFRVVCAPFLFHNNDITIRNQKLSNDITQYTTPEYSDNTIGDTCVDGFQSSTHKRLMLDGVRREEKLDRTTSKIAEPKVNFEK
jgi:hypothetical protein